MSKEERRPTDAVYTPLQQGNVFVDTVGVFCMKWTTFVRCVEEMYVVSLHASLTSKSAVK